METTPPIRLRPHHFLCMLTFVGEGYTPAFVARFRELVERMNGGAEVEIVEGPDDVCEPMMCCRDLPQFHCENRSVRDRDAIARREIDTALDRYLHSHGVGERVVPRFQVGRRIRITPDLVCFLRDEFRSQRIRSACRNCEWFDLCGKISGGGFQGALLKD